MLNDGIGKRDMPLGRSNMPPGNQETTNAVNSATNG